jgi:hypothetical protein
VASYIAECAARLKVGSIQRRLNAIAEAHNALGLESPTHTAMVANTMKGIRRIKGTAPAQKAAALTDDVRTMVEAAGEGGVGTVHHEPDRVPLGSDATALHPGR